MKLERKPVRGAVVASLVTLLLGFLYFYFTLDWVGELPEKDFLICFWNHFPLLKYIIPR